MKTLILFYSYSGKTKAIAERLAAAEAADIKEIKDAKPLGKLKAYTAGIIAAGSGKAWQIKPLEVNLEGYDNLILLAPIWAGNPAPAFNSVLGLLPKGKTVAVKMVSMSGKSSCRERLEAAIKSRGSIMKSFEDIKA